MLAVNFTPEMIGQLASANQSSASVYPLGLMAVVSAFLHEEVERSRKILPEKKI